MSGSSYQRQIDRNRELETARTAELVKRFAACSQHLGAGTVRAATSTRAASGNRTAKARSAGQARTTAGVRRAAGTRTAGSARSRGSAGSPGSNVSELGEAAAALATHPVVGPEAEELAMRAITLHAAGAADDSQQVSELSRAMHELAVRAAQDAQVIEALACGEAAQQGLIAPKEVAAGPDGSTRIILGAQTGGQLEIDVVPHPDGSDVMNVHTARAGIDEAENCDAERDFANRVIDDIVEIRSAADRGPQTTPRTVATRASKSKMHRQHEREHT